MLRTPALIALTTCISSLTMTPCSAQAPAAPPRTTGGLSLGLSGVRSGDGTTIVGDVMWVGDEMNDGPGFRIVRQALAPRAHAYAAMLVIGGPPSDSIQWMRLDFGLGYVGQQSDRSLKFYQRHGIGAQFATTIAPWKIGFMRPELNGWAIVGTSARFLGASVGARLLLSRNH